jgi:hypothetical protein
MSRNALQAEFRRGRVEAFAIARVVGDVGGTVVDVIAAPRRRAAIRRERCEPAERCRQFASIVVPALSLFSNARRSSIWARSCASFDAMGGRPVSAVMIAPVGPTTL